MSTKMLLFDKNRIMLLYVPYNILLCMYVHSTRDKTKETVIPLKIT